MRVEPARPEHAPVIHQMVQEIAAYERLAHEVTATLADTARAFFGERPLAEALLAWVGPQPAGFAVFYPFYSTFAGRGCLYLEDVFVREPFRRRGIGRRLVEAFLTTARKRACPKVEWRVLRWNEPALAFYRSLGALILDEWVPVRLELRPGGEAEVPPRAS